jgi:hypothetical protein
MVSVEFLFSLEDTFSSSHNVDLHTEIQFICTLMPVIQTSIHLLHFYHLLWKSFSPGVSFSVCYCLEEGVRLELLSQRTMVRTINRLLGVYKLQYSKTLFIFFELTCREIDCFCQAWKTDLNRKGCRNHSQGLESFL